LSVALGNAFSVSIDVRGYIEQPPNLARQLTCTTFFGFNVVLRNAISILIKKTQVVLSRKVAFLAA
jgi:hypothetical protein